MAMTALNISLPEALKEYVEGQVSSSGWGTPSEYLLRIAHGARDLESLFQIHIRFAIAFPAH